ncbi:MAG: hypothetical protein ABIK89_18715, partial [Planctomycetota bacterium]
MPPAPDPNSGAGLIADLPGHLARPVRPCLLIGIAHNMCREVIPHQVRLFARPAEYQGVEHRVEPALVVGRLGTEFGVGAGHALLRGAVVTASRRTALAQGQLGRSQIGLGRGDGLHGALLHVGHELRRHPAPLPELLKGRHAVIVRGDHVDVLGRDSRALRGRPLDPPGHLLSRGQQVERTEGPPSPAA